MFGGVTDRLIPLFAVGAFMAFTLSQAGMVFHWRRLGGRGAVQSMMVNGLGAFVTGLTVLVVLVAKFAEGAWITVLLIPALLLAMVMVRRHYDRVANAIASPTPLELKDFRPALVVVPIQSWSIVAKKAVRFALTISPEVIGLQIGAEQTDDLRPDWERYVEKPVMEIGLPTPKLVEISSPYRYVLLPIVDYVLELHKKDPSRQIAVVIPELVEQHWYYYFLHNQRAAALKALLYVKGNQQIAVVNVPWYLDF
jgi:hypothetical protein